MEAQLEANPEANVDAKRLQGLLIKAPQMEPPGLHLWRRSSHLAASLSSYVSLVDRLPDPHRPRRRPRPGPEPEVLIGPLPRYKVTRSESSFSSAATGGFKLLHLFTANR